MFSCERRDNCFNRGAAMAEAEMESPGKLEVRSGGMIKVSCESPPKLTRSSTSGVDLEAVVAELYQDRRTAKRGARTMRLLLGLGLVGVLAILGAMFAVVVTANE